MPSASLENIFNEVTQALRTHSPNRQDVDYIKSVDSAVQAITDVSVNKANAEKIIHDSALEALPKSTCEVIQKARSQGSRGGLAIELVRRDLTELNILARTLHASTEEERREDGGLRALHNALSRITELFGALVSEGVNVEEKEWAKLLVAGIPTLRQLRSTPWTKVALILQLDLPEAGKQSTPLKHPLSSAEIRIVKKLYAIGEGAPMIRQQVLDCGLGLDVAEQLEKAEIYDATARGDTGRLISLAVEKLREGKAEQMPKKEATDRQHYY